ncbi:MAG TPA: septum formation initiator family protein [Vicinamibacterales bacterium]|nr:septum formation initiator family protein [Vicinamibacterales bacterium]HWI16256.1 septum formation initiator family protein [Vicinamibacterales bacterium]
MPQVLRSDTRAPRGPEPLRRKRVEPAPAGGSRRRKLLNLCLGFATVVLLVDALVGEKGLMERMRARRQYAEAAASLNGLKAENQRLREQARRLRDDPSAIETIAREELGLIRPGELLFIVRDAKPAGR